MNILHIIFKRITNSISNAFNIRTEERQTVIWAWLYVFSLFLAYYVLRPIRDELGVAGGVRNLPWLFTGTLVAMLMINPFFAAIVKHWPKDKFIAITYRFFMANLLVFMVLLSTTSADNQIWIGRGFFYLGIGIQSICNFSVLVSHC